MVPEDLLFWIAPFAETADLDARVLCRRHADAMVVPLSWTLDDRREDQPQLFKPSPLAPPVQPVPPRRPRTARRQSEQPQQLQIDGTGEIERPAVSVPEAASQPARLRDEPAVPWQPDFDVADDLDGLLEVSSPLLARAFRGTDRPRR
jgi:hypothetical protein